MEKNTLMQFFELVRSGLWGHPADSGLFCGGDDWKTLFRMASMQALVGLFADGAGTLPKELMPPSELVRRLYVLVEASRRANLQLDSVLAELVTLLRENGIEGVLLKGQGLSRDYLVPGHRMCGDIDFYVAGKENYLRSCELVRSMGEKEGEESESDKHFHFNRKGCQIEIHKRPATDINPFADRRLKRWTRLRLGEGCGMRTLEIGGVAVNLPPAAFDSVFILQHISNHMLKGGVGLRQLCDWCRYLYVHGGEIDCLQLSRDLDMLHLKENWQLMGYIAVNMLGLPEEMMPFYTPRAEKKAMRCLEIILSSGNFGKYGKNASAGHHACTNVMLRKMHSCSLVLSRQAGLLKVIPRDVLAYVPWYILDGVRRAISTDKG